MIYQRKTLTAILSCGSRVRVPHVFYKSINSDLVEQQKQIVSCKTNNNKDVIDMDKQITFLDIVNDFLDRVVDCPDRMSHRQLLRNVIIFMGNDETSCELQPLLTKIMAVSAVLERQQFEKESLMKTANGLQNSLETIIKSVLDHHKGIYGYDYTEPIGGDVSFVRKEKIQIGHRGLAYVWGGPGPDCTLYDWEDYGKTWALTRDELRSTNE